MLDPQKMVVTSGIAFVVILLIVFLYLHYFAKKKINYYFLIFLFSLPPLVSIFRPGTYESGDLSLHTMRTISFYNILFNEHLLPRWTPEFNVGYGDPHFLFAYFLPYFLGSIFHFIGFSFLDSIKLLLFLSFMLSGYTMYVWAKDELGEKAGFVSAIFYLFVPYHLVDLHFRVTIAETLSFVFLPLLLLLTKKIIHHTRLHTIILFAITYCLFILTHQIISLLFTPILLAYALFVWYLKKKRKYKEIFYYGSSFALGLFISAFYWLPIIIESKYTQASLAKNISTFTSLPELLYSPWRFGFLFQGHMGELSFLIGYTQLFVIAIAIYFLIKGQLDKKFRYLLLFFLTLLVLLIFMITPQSTILWEKIPLLQFAQYSYRLLVFVALCTSIIAGIVVTKWNKNIFIICLCLLTISYTILNWGNRGTIPKIKDQYLIKEFKNKPDVGMYLEPSSPLWVDLKRSNVRKKPTKHLEIVSGNATVKEIARTSIRHTYVINAQSAITIKENTLYFPGWELLIDDKQYPFTYTNKKYPGIIILSLPKGVYHLELTFRDTSDRILASRISFIASVSVVALLLFSWIKKRKTRKK